MQEWVEDTDVGGFNLVYAVTPKSFEDAVDCWCRSCRSASVYKTDCLQGTLREKLGGSEPRLVAPHRRPPSRSSARLRPFRGMR